MKGPAIAPRMSGRAVTRSRVRHVRRRAECGTGVGRWRALEREQFLALLAAPARNTPKEGSRSW